MSKKYKYYLGIDPGVNTGMALWDTECKNFVSIRTYKIHQAIEIVLTMQPEEVYVRLEDARLRRWFGKAGPEQLQGAGSIKRDCSIWEDLLTDKGMTFELVAPKTYKTKTSAEYFERLTGYSGKTNEHSRDAAMLVYGK